LVQGDGVWQKDMRQYWEPLFDAYHVAVGFENHSHRYGRAQKLKAGKVDQTGTLYLGGGSFGVTPSSNNCTMAWLGYCPTGNPWYMVNIQQKRHFLHVTVRCLSFSPGPLCGPARVAHPTSPLFCPHQVTPDEIFIEAIDEHGDTFDHASAL
jgi:hypothetical protein